jgi:hypothetical protein
MDEEDPSEKIKKDRAGAPRHVSIIIHTIYPVSGSVMIVYYLNLLL